MPVAAKMMVYIHPASTAVEDEFNRWYDHVHIPEVLERFPSMGPVQRLRLTDEQLVSSDNLPARRYLTIYDVDTDDLQGLADELGAALADGTLAISRSVDLSPDRGPLIIYYGPIA